MKAEALEKLRADFKDVLAALRTHALELARVPGLAVARPGYALEGDTKEPALVLAFHPTSPAADVATLSAQLGVSVRAAIASPEEQIQGATQTSFASPLRNLLDPVDAPDFAPPERGNYQPPTGPGAPRLDPIDAEMEVTVCASPDAGWPVLRDFFAEGVQDRLVVAMYDFTARHVEEALVGALEGSNATFQLVIDGKPASGGVGGNGVNGPDRPEADVLKRLRRKLGNRFELARASVGSGGAVPKAYHIKVAVADGTRTWASSGNWQSSNQAPFDYAKPGDKPPLPISRYNRDYHTIVRNAALAECFARFIEYDATLGGPFAQAEPEPMLLVPLDLEEPAEFTTPERFEPLTIKEKVRVTPLLTPDNFPGFVNALLARAKKRVWIQNQYIQPKAQGDNFPEFDRLMELLGELAGQVDLRLCLRTPAEADRDRLIAAGVLPSQIRRQSNCHAKLIVVDDDHVIVGSQNLSNVGFVANRDASLAFEHEQITGYFARIFEQDWDRATPIADGDSFGIRVARDDETPPGFARVPWSDVFDSPPPLVPALSPIASTPRGGPAPPPAVARPMRGGTRDMPLFGVDEDGRRETESSKSVASALRLTSGGIDPERRALGLMATTPSFGLPPGAAAENLDEVGWGVVWAPNTSQAIKDALRKLVGHRRQEVADDGLLHELEYVPGDSARVFLQRNAVDFGSIRPDAVPYYLLLVGTPEQIPFSFQSVLDVEYRVGRLDLPDAAAYERYAQSVVDVEKGQSPARLRVLHAFGPAHDGDGPTALSVEVLVRAAARWLDAFGNLKTKHGLSSITDDADKATKARLVEILRASRPEVLFTAGHGMAIGSGKPRQLGEQGALVTADWDGFSPVDAGSRFAGADVPLDADVEGLVAFLFACFGAGTPATDSFPTRAGQVLAPKPFVSALPQALLAHAKGGALGVFGHVDRTLTWSLQPPTAPVATDPFARAAVHVLAGSRLGAALDDLNQRGASLAAAVANGLGPGAAPIGDVELVRTWTQQRDAAAFLLLGDPAARLPR